jgi:formate hydrogenlyase subunit 3/multisubunit Na+/H+ antiporter MnhD subunit
MLRIFIGLAASLALGAVLAWSWTSWPFWPGAFGAALLVLTAGVVCWRWDRGAAIGEEPGPYERRAWHSMASLAVVASHLSVALASGLDLHVGRGNTLAVDNWLLILGAALGWIVMRPRSMDRDERDAEMANRGAHAGFRALIGLLVVLLIVLGFAPASVTERLNAFVIGNLLVALILFSLLTAFVTQLLGYWAASRPEQADG